MVRVRDNSRTVPFSWYDKEINLRTGAITQPHSSLVPCVQADVMTDTVTKKFGTLSRLGSIIMNPMEKLNTSVEMLSVGIWKQKPDTANPPNIWRYESNGRSDWLTFDIKTFAPAIEAITRLEGLAITDAYAGVGSPDVATLTELAEGRETLSFLLSPVKKMVKITRAFDRHLRSYESRQRSYARALDRWTKLPPRARRNRPKPLPPAFPRKIFGEVEVKDIPSFWLAYRYAIMPLIYTVQDIQGLLKKRLTEQPRRVTSRGKATGSVSMNVNSPLFLVDNRQGNVSEQVHLVGNIEVSCRAGVLYVPEIGLQSQLGFQFNRVPAALYEAIPLSFVTDWFHNGSSYYDALTAEFRSQAILGAWVTTTVKYDGYSTFTMLSRDAKTSTMGTVRTCNLRGTWKRRNLTSLSDVQLSLRVSMNTKRVADGLALISTFLATARKT